MEPNPTESYSEEGTANHRQINYCMLPPILIIDDEEDILDFLEKILNRYHILRSESAKNALQILKSEAVQLIICDVMMPGNRWL